ncbi:T9SS type A sorting domain-containing protein [Flavobacterium sp. 5]|uniref:T9SS type A sorting domain-containing protein n=1 Tax=Flavobacterium sp. 5 TaxID=2035199 RepID=UPI000C2CBB32|nr:T9SS type A sorting domain-containing protein [Flavobacterium sp. 5]PKB16622.1 putative delta-60 repeat protein/predicted secreted protein (Por secretion system target) [Flavobacterium sp. 5]
MKKFYSLLLLTLFGILSSYAQTVDETFVKPIPYKSAKVAVIKELPDGKILLGGDIGFYKDKTVKNLIRLNADYSLDETFVFNGDLKFKIKDVKFQSNGNIIVLTTSGNSGYADYFMLYQLDSNGGIIKEVSTIFNATSIAVQGDDKILVTGGEIGYYSFTSCYLHRYNSDFSLDETFNNDLAFNASTNTVVVSNDGIFVSGLFSSVDGISKNSIVKLKFDGTIDDTFDVGIGAKGRTFSMTLQNNDKLVIGGNFKPSTDLVSNANMIRLNTDGSIDNSFSCEYYSYENSTVIIKDTYIYISAGINNGVEFTFYIIRLNSDGSLDASFSPGKLNETSYDFTMGIVGDKILYNNSENTGNKYGVSVCDLSGSLLESSELKASRFGSFQIGDYLDGKLVVSGDFIKVNDVETFGIALMDESGTVDKSFVLPKYLGEIRQFQIVDDNTIFVSTINKLLKLNSKGEVLKDFDFKTDTQLINMYQFKVLNDGKILASDSGTFCKLNADGTVELTFNFNPIENFWTTAVKFELQDDKIICGVMYTTFNSDHLYKLLRFNLDGSIDETFNINGSGPDYSIEKIKVLDTGEIIVAGGFKIFNGISDANQVVKLSKDGEMDLPFNENQKASPIGYSTDHGYVKLEQGGAVLYITEVDGKVTALNLDGTFVNNFEMPAGIDQVTDIIALDEETALVTSKSKAKSVGDLDNYIFAIGTPSNSQSFIVKINVGKPSGSLSVGPTLEQLSSSIQLYPVPVSSQMNLSFSNLISPTKISIYSMNGAELYSAKIQSADRTEVDMSKFSSGTYIVKLYTTSGETIKKVVKK